MFKKVTPKKIAIFALVVFVLFNVGIFITVTILSRQTFGTRYDTKIKYNYQDFKGMIRTESSFTSNEGQHLKGYVYSKQEETKPKALIILSHGFGGGGHNSYLPQIYYFINNGYWVFAYDGTGCDESEGKNVIGLPQAVIDLDYAIRYVKEESNLKNLKLLLYGQSWGGYAVTTVGNLDNNISAVVSLSGFSNVTDLSVNQAKGMIGPIASIISPYVKLYNYIGFGKVANYTGIGGLDKIKSNAKVMIVQSEDDKVVSYNNFTKYKNTFGDNKNFEFISYKDRGHSVELSSDVTNEVKEEVAAWKSLVNEKGEENIPESEKDEFYKNYLSTNVKIDMDLMKEIVKFYDDAIK
ncbi:alpha/beta hydrolase family protein [Clostridium paridis]|uniref:Alpha/beta hydrolase n=1 Tax=Clostridium paridis TaxID=2803863 RepID=A0A937FHL6_9CLOT|nr:alpha/beta fold hydrolase [Clostridium paridis]MBL4932152.1 alpha/beta hydrolase [Clostridium paridis]